MRIGSMDRVPKEKRKFSVMELSIFAILIAGLCFVFINVIVSIARWIIPIITKNYVVIIIAVIVIFVLIKFLKGRKKKKKK